MGFIPVRKWRSPECTKQNEPAKSHKVPSSASTLAVWPISTTMFRGALSGFVPMGRRLLSTMPTLVRPVFSPPLHFPLSLIVAQNFPTLAQVVPLARSNIDVSEEADSTIYMDSVLRKRRLKMKKHKLRKRRKAQRSLMQRLGKI